MLTDKQTYGMVGMLVWSLRCGMMNFFSLLVLPKNICRADKPVPV